MREMPDLSFSAVCKGQYEAGYADALRDVGAALRKLQSLSGRRDHQSSSDHEYLEKIADQVIARNHSKAEATRNPAVEVAMAQRGADASKVVCPALIDDVGGQ